MRRVNRLTVLSRAIAGSASAGPAIAEHRLPFFGSFSSSKSGGFAKYGSEPLGNSNPSASLGGAAFFSASATSLAQEAAPRSLNFYNKVKETMRQSQEGRALRQLTLSSGKSAGRNSSGRITIFHRGGGSKRLQRRIDLKRSTSSIGIVERVEYDPNRSSRIALVRWIEGVHLRRQRKCNTTEKFTPPHRILEPTTTTVRGLFSLSSLPRKVEQRKVACLSPGLKAGNVVVGHPTRMPPCSRSPLTSKGAESENSCVKDVFFSAFSSTKAKGEISSFSVGSSCGFPRIAVAGAKAAFFTPQVREEARGKNTFSLGEIQKWRPHSILWAHRIKRKAALSW